MYAVLHKDDIYATNAVVAIPEARLSDTIENVSQKNELPLTASTANGRFDTPCKMPHTTSERTTPILTISAPPRNPPKIVAATPHSLTTVAICVFEKPASLYNFGTTVPMDVSHNLYVRMNKMMISQSLRVTKSAIGATTASLKKFF